MQLQIGKQHQYNVQVALDYSYNFQHERKKDSNLAAADLGAFLVLFKKE